MTLAHGVDIIEIDRIEKAILANPRFVSKIYTATEIAYCESKKHKYPSFAVRFAAKEAFLKALGTGWVAGITFADIEVCNDTAGKPYIALSGQGKIVFETTQYSRIMLSMSHSKYTAVASVILQ